MLDGIISMEKKLPFLNWSFDIMAQKGQFRFLDGFHEYVKQYH
jgi:hypothetical protein